MEYVFYVLAYRSSVVKGPSKIMIIKFWWTKITLTNPDVSLSKWKWQKLFRQQTNLRKEKYQHKNATKNVRLHNDETVG